MGTKTTTNEALGHDFKETSRIEATCTQNGKIVNTCSRCNQKQEKTIQTTGHKSSIVYNSEYHWYECDVCSIMTGEKEAHKYDENDVCKVCGYKLVISDDEYLEDDDELIVEPWMKEDNSMKELAVSLRNDSDEYEKGNKNFYALNEEIVYYVDYKNGGDDITKAAKIVLELPLDFKVIDAFGGLVDAKEGTITWNFPEGIEEDYAGTKVVKVAYTGFDRSSKK